MTIILPIGGLVVAGLIILYGLYQRHEARRWKCWYDHEQATKRAAIDQVTRLQDYALDADEIILETRAQRDRLNTQCAQLQAAAKQQHGRFEQAVLRHAEDMNHLNAGYEGVISGLKSRIAELEGGAPPVVLDSAAPAPVAAGSDGEPQYAVKKPRKRASGKPT